jgi:Spy/CpxP family protein refolding chaperone
MKAGKLLLVLAAVGLLGVGSYTLGARAADTSSPVSVTDWAEHPFRNFIRGQTGRFMVLRSQLDLTSDQKEQIAAILKAHKSEIVQAVQPIVEKRRALREAVTTANPDEKDAAVLASKMKQQIAPIFTDKQRQEIKDFRAQSDTAVDDFFSKIAQGQ